MSSKGGSIRAVSDKNVGNKPRSVLRLEGKCHRDIDGEVHVLIGTTLEQLDNRKGSHEAWLVIKDRR